MNRRTLTTWLSTLLFLIAGLAGTVHGAPAPEPEPCHKMAQAAETGHGGHSQHMGDNSETDCLTDCQCCPGSCSSASALTASQWQAPVVTEGAFSAYALSHPHSTPFELLRPPTKA